VKAATPLRGGHCPRCGKDLFSYDADGVALDECGACGGIWFDRNEIQRVLDLRVDHVPRTDTSAWPTNAPRLAPATQEGALACVRCRARMTRRAVAPEAEVVADFCEHGLWLDGGELERFRAFSEGGGLARAGLPLSSTPPRRPSRGHRVSEQGLYRSYPHDRLPWDLIRLVAASTMLRRR
jgi:Zn-finger nucleic acid-binding protein